jgi:hypothetical protein
MPIICREITGSDATSSCLRNLEVLKEEKQCHKTVTVNQTTVVEVVITTMALTQVTATVVTLIRVGVINKTKTKLMPSLLTAGTNSLG